MDIRPEDIVYRMGPTAEKMHSSPAFVRCIRGPRGSGKSSMCCAELRRWGECDQDPGPDGVRRTRFAVIRNTYRELEDTTIKTWSHWFPQDQFPINRGSMSCVIGHDGMEMEVLFRALDRPADVKKTLSLELTGAWVNEAREVPKGVIDGLLDAVGRYPAANMGGCTREGLIMDTNSMDDDHWWYRLANVDLPQGWVFFDQPGGLLEDPETGEFVPNPEAENLENLKGGVHYYLTRVPGKGKDHIRVYYCNQYGFVMEGKPVFPEYIDARHAAKERIEPNPDLTLYVGLDFGLTPAAAFLQKDPGLGRWNWVDELVTEDMGALKFGPLLKERLNRDYRDFNLEIYGDPAGDDRVQTDEKTPFLVLRAQGIPVMKAPSQDPTLRRDALAKPMTTMCMDGDSAFRISPHCTVARKGLKGGYCLKRIQVAGEERFHEKPSKNRYSHVIEAGEYALLGAGEGSALLNKGKGVPGNVIDIRKRRRIHRPGGRDSWMGM